MKKARWVWLAAAGWVVLGLAQGSAWAQEGQASGAQEGQASGASGERVLSAKVRAWGWAGDWGMTQAEVGALCEEVVALHGAGCKWGAPSVCRGLGRVQGLGGLACEGVVLGVCSLGAHVLSEWDAPRACRVLGLGRTVEREEGR